MIKRMIRAIVRILKNKAFIILFLHLIFCILLILSKFDLTNIGIFKDEFIIPIVLSILGLLLTIFTLLYALLDKIIQTFNRLNVCTDNIFKSLKELCDNTKFIFYVFLIMFLLAVSDSCDIPFVKQPISMNKHLIIYDIKIIMVSLTFIATRDSILTLFSFLELLKKSEK